MRRQATPAMKYCDNLAVAPIPRLKALGGGQALVATRESRLESRELRM